LLGKIDRKRIENGNHSRSSKQSSISAKERQAIRQEDRQAGLGFLLSTSADILLDVIFNLCRSRLKPSSFLSPEAGMKNPPPVIINVAALRAAERLM
jgi:hypothetical protein